MEKTHNKPHGWEEIGKEKRSKYQVLEIGRAEPSINRKDKTMA
jgi:hypothetical protein